MANSNNRNFFNVFARNWALHEKVSGTPVFVCPLCLKHFTANQIQELSKEHVPPSKMGGTVQTLTCSRCNNDQGSKLESKVLDYLKLGLFWQRKIDTPPKLNFAVSAGQDPDTKISVDLKHNSINFNSSRSNPSNVEAFAKRISERKPRSFTLNYTVHFNAGMVGFLRMAYLQIFSLLGYSAILHKNYTPIRRQINKPVPLLFPPMWLLPGEFQDEYLGVNIVYYPPEVRSILVVFDLSIEKSVSQRVGIFMPGFDDLGTSIYSIMEPLKDTPISLATMPLSTFLDMGLLNLPNAAELVWEACFNNPDYERAVARIREQST
jgi:hypothetical protein